MNNPFFKYQSLGNDFIVFDWLDTSHEVCNDRLSQSTWAEQVRAWCQRHTGIGADGILVVQQTPAGQPAMRIFNADGSEGANCLNGARCVAQHLVMQRELANEGSFFIGARVVHYVVADKHGAVCMVTTGVGTVDYHGERTIAVHDFMLHGFYAEIGNPHFIMMREEPFAWFADVGAALQHHQAFPVGINVECLWQTAADRYHMRVYERGAGMTQACSSGAAAVLGVLDQQNAIIKNQRITITMPGGVLAGWVNEEQEIFLEAPAVLVFRGMLEMK